MQRRDLFGQLVTVQRHAGLQSQHIACAQTRRNQTRAGVVGQELRPDFGGIFAVDENLETVLAGVARTRDDRFLTVHVAFGTKIIFQGIELEIDVRLQHRHRSRSLNCNQRVTAMP